jgi:hypothetical protein
MATTASETVTPLSDVASGRGRSSGLVRLDEWDTMTSLTEEDTGIARTIFLIMRHGASHGPRIKIAVDPPHGLNSRTGVIVYTVGDNPQVARNCQRLPPAEEREVIRFIRLNREVITHYYNGQVSGSGAVRAIQSIAGLAEQERRERQKRPKKQRAPKRSAKPKGRRPSRKVRAG